MLPLLPLLPTSPPGFSTINSNRLQEELQKGLQKGLQRACQLEPQLLEGALRMHKGEQATTASNKRGLPETT